MSVIPGPSGAVNSTLVTISANLTSVISEVWTIIGTNIEITFGSPPVTAACPQPQGTWLFLRHQHKEVASYPALMVYSINGHDYADAAPQWGSWAHKLMVEAWLAHESEEVVQEQLLRVVECLWLIFERNQMLDGKLSGPHGVEAPDYTICYKPPPVGKVLVGVQMPITVYVDEGAMHS